MTAPYPATSSATIQRPRLLFLDLFRGLAVFFMFDAHITDALVKLAPGASRIHQWHNLTFNLPAPAFLFAAGLSFGMTAYSRWDQFHAGFDALSGRLARIVEVLFVAYLLHAPAASLSASLKAPESVIRRFLGWDILQCIGYTLLLLVAIAVLLPRRHWFLRAAAAITLIISFASAWLWDVPWSATNVPWWIATIFSKQLGSNFPFFPYAVFLTAGSVWGYLFAHSQESGAIRSFMKKSLWIGVSMVAASLLITQVSLPVPYDDFWGGSPVFICMRIGLLAALLAALYFFEAALVPALGFVIVLGKESLTVYFVHLLIVYGSPVTSAWNLRALFPDGIGLWTWLGLLISMTVAMTALAWCWGWMKQRLGDRFDRLLWIAGALAIVIFAVR